MISTIAGCFRLTRGAGYALRAAAALALQRDGETVTIRELARREGIPPSFLAKVIRPLVRAGLVTAKPGAGGGIRLAAAPARLRVLRMIETLDGPYTRASCVFFPNQECNGETCPSSCVLRREEERARNALSRLTLAQIVPAFARHPARAAAEAAS